MEPILELSHSAYRRTDGLVIQRVGFGTSGLKFNSWFHLHTESGGVLLVVDAPHSWMYSYTIGPSLRQSSTS